MLKLVTMYTKNVEKICFLCAFPVTARENQNKAASCVESRFHEIDKKILVSN